jgi:hypothetical protein
MTGFKRDGLENPRKEREERSESRAEQGGEGLIEGRVARLRKKMGMA